MKTIRVYTYAKCSSCRKATAWLDAQGLDYEEIPIQETPPSKDELKRMEQALGGKRGRLFNTSGREYRSLGLKEQLPTMSADEAYALLNSNGMLVKRPFLLTPQGGAVGFREAEWSAVLS